MAVIRVFCDSVKKCREEDIDTVKDWGMKPGEWEKANEKDRYRWCEGWACDSLEIGYESLEEWGYESL